MSGARENVIVGKTENFADRITKMYRYLSEQRLGDKDMLKQIVRSGTSVGANVSEGQFAQTKADFLTKMTIALKEANETDYWLRLLGATNCLTSNQLSSLQKDLSEIIALLMSICKSTQANLSRTNDL